MNPVTVELLIKCFYKGVPNTPSDYSISVTNGLLYLVTNSLIRTDPETNLWETTPRGADHVKQICSLQFLTVPERVEAKLANFIIGVILYPYGWVMGVVCHFKGHTETSITNHYGYCTRCGKVHIAEKTDVKR